jgi:hypothetical protein
MGDFRYLLSRTGGKRNAYSVIVGVPGGKRQHGRPRLKWEDILNGYLRKIIG